MYNKIIVEGSKLCAEILLNKLAEVHEIFATQSFFDAHPKIDPGAAEVFQIDSKTMKKISALKTPSSIFMICARPEFHAAMTASHVRHSLYLDGIRDPGNMGTIIRTADWFGIQALFISEDCVEVFSPKVVQASMGSVFRVHCKEVGKTNMDSLANEYDLIGTEMTGKDVFHFDFPPKCLIVVGNEGQGISDAVRAHLTDIVCIPGDHRLGAESLNVGISSGILMAAMIR